MESLNNKSIFLIGEVNEHMTLNVFEELLGESLEEPLDSLDTLTVHISSPGGVLHDCFAIVDLLSQLAKQHDFKIITYGHGQIASAGFFLFILGDVRILNPKCRVFVHEHITDVDVIPYSKLIDSLKEDKRLYKMYTDYVSEQLNISYADSKKLLAKDCWLTAADVDKYNLVTGDSNG